MKDKQMHSARLLQN